MRNYDDFSRSFLFSLSMLFSTVGKDGKKRHSPDITRKSRRQKQPPDRKSETGESPALISMSGDTAKYWKRTLKKHPLSGVPVPRRYILSNRQTSGTEDTSCCWFQKRARIISCSRRYLHRSEQGAGYQENRDRQLPRRLCTGCP